MDQIRMLRMLSQMQGQASCPPRTGPGAELAGSRPPSEPLEQVVLRRMLVRLDRMATRAEEKGDLGVMADVMHMMAMTVGSLRASEQPCEVNHPSLSPMVLGILGEPGDDDGQTVEVPR